MGTVRDGMDTDKRRDEMTTRKTFNRGQLFKLVKAGRVYLTESYSFDDMYGSERQQGIRKPVAIRPEDMKDRKEGIAYLFESDFSTKSGCAWKNANGTVTLIIHSNCNVTLAID